jgi:hypothetical protein
MMPYQPAYLNCGSINLLQVGDENYSTTCAHTNKIEITYFYGDRLQAAISVPCVGI